MEISSSFQELEETQLFKVEGGVDPGTACVVLFCFLCFLVGVANGLEG